MTIQLKGFKALSDGYVELSTGEFFSETGLRQFHDDRCKAVRQAHRIGYVGAKSDKYGQINIEANTKHRNNLKRMALLLSITSRKVEQINKVYLLATASGIIEEGSPAILKALGKDWRRCFKRLATEGWLKQVTSTSSKNLWMVNPDWTTARDVWPKQQQRWLYDCYKSGVYRKSDLSYNIDHSTTQLNTNEEIFTYENEETHRNAIHILACSQRVKRCSSHYTSIYHNQ